MHTAADSRRRRHAAILKIVRSRTVRNQAELAAELERHELAANQADGVFTVADFRNLSGIGRNAVVEILEYFDRAGLTRRHGQVRKLIAPAG